MPAATPSPCANEMSPIIAKCPPWGKISLVKNHCIKKLMISHFGRRARWEGLLSCGMPLQPLRGGPNTFLEPLCDFHFPNVPSSTSEVLKRSGKVPLGGSLLWWGGSQASEHRVFRGSTEEGRIQLCSSTGQHCPILGTPLIPKKAYYGLPAALVGGGGASSHQIFLSKFIKWFTWYDR